MTTPTMKSSLGEALLVVCVFTGLSLAFSWPLLPHIRTLVPAGSSTIDPPLLMYALGWGAEAFRHAPLHYFDAPFFYPYNNTLAFLDPMFGVVFFAAPIMWATGSLLLTYNLTWLLTFVICGCGAYALAKELTQSRASAFLAGVLFAFYPFRYHNAGALNVLTMMWLPIALLFFHRWLRDGKARDGLLFALVSVLQILTSGYTGPFLLMIVMIFCAVLFVQDRPQFKALWKTQRGFAAWILAVSLVVVGAFAIPYFKNASAGFGIQRSVGETMHYSALPIDFVTAAPGSFLANANLTELARHALFPGFVATALVLFWIGARGWRRSAGALAAHQYGWLMALTGVFALGPWLGSRGDGVPLPYLAVYYLFPGAGMIRAPVRYSVLFSLAVAVLAAMAFVLLCRAVQSRKPGLATALRVLVPLAAAAELFAAPVNLLDVLPNGTPDLYLRMAALPDSAVIVEWPMPRDEHTETYKHGRYQLYGLAHGKRLVNGVAAWVPPQTKITRALMQEFPSTTSLDHLRELGVTHVVVHTNADQLDGAPSIEREVRDEPRLQLVDEGDGVLLMRLRDS